MGTDNTTAPKVNPAAQAVLNVLANPLELIGPKGSMADKKAQKVISYRQFREKHPGATPAHYGLSLMLENPIVDPAMQEELDRRMEDPAHKLAYLERTMENALWMAGELKRESPDTERKAYALVETFTRRLAELPAPQDEPLSLPALVARFSDLWCVDLEDFTGLYENDPGAFFALGLPRIIVDGAPMVRPSDFDRFMEELCTEKEPGLVGAP
jgi:hypothetical protein